MRELVTDYLVVGAGASGMAFVDSLVEGSDCEVVMVDRRHRPGGHWVDAYPFVLLHQPSANYGVTSRRLGHDRIDRSGPNAGFYERSTATEICDYYTSVLEETFVPSGRVRFLGMSDYRGEDADGHHVVSRVNGSETVIRVRCKFVDATYVESSIPSRHTPSYGVDPDVRLITPNDLVDVTEAPAGYTIVGAGKTASDTCNWLLDNGVDADRLQWIRPRDAWQFNREYTQPLELVGHYMELQARWIEACAEATSGADLARRLAADDILVRIDPDVEPSMFRGATISRGEVESLRTITRVVRKGKVRHIGAQRITFDDAEIPAQPGQVYVDCTAAGLRPAPARPVYEPDRISLQYVTIGIAPWSAATVGAVEVRRDDDEEKNRLCPPLVFSGDVGDLLTLTLPGVTGLMARAAEPDLVEWNEACRLNPARGAATRTEDQQVQSAFMRIMTSMGPALANLGQRVAGAAAAPA